mgnify:CR=1 FL=1
MRLRSILLEEWVKAPAEIKSTPVCATEFNTSRVIPPDASVSDFIVVSLPSIIDNKEQDEKGGYNWYETTAQIEVYIKDIPTSANPVGLRSDVLTAKINSIKALFPIKDKINGFKMIRPRFFPIMKDDSGFHFMIIQAKLTTLF